MSGYEHLSPKEAESIWDKEQMPNVKADPEPCDLYDVCKDCPNFSDCFGVPPSSEAGKTYYPKWFWYRKPKTSLWRAW